MVVHILQGRGWEAWNGFGVGERIGFWWSWWKRGLVVVRMRGGVGVGEFIGTE
jgi:hypothetical protein